MNDGLVILQHFSRSNFISFDKNHYWLRRKIIAPRFYQEKFVLAVNTFIQETRKQFQEKEAENDPVVQNFQKFVKAFIRASTLSQISTSTKAEDLSHKIKNAPPGPAPGAVNL